MKTRERINLLRKAKGFTHQISLAEDDFPGTEFDGLFLDCAEAWAWTHRAEPNAAKLARCPVAKSFLKTGSQVDGQSASEEDERASEFFASIGRCLADACVLGESDFIRQLANALDTWTQHRPQRDAIRTALLLICLPRSQTFSVRQIIQRLPRYGVRVDENTPRIVRRITRELGIKVSGTTGKPSKGNADTNRRKSRR